MILKTALDNRKYIWYHIAQFITNFINRLVRVKQVSWCFSVRKATHKEYTSILS